MITVLRPLSTSELLDRTFHLYRNNFLVFVGIAAIPQLFVLPLTLGGAAMLARRSFATSIALTLSGYLLFYLAAFIAQAATVQAVSCLYTEKPVGIGKSYSAAKKALLRLTWILFLLFLVMVGLFGVTGGLIAAAVAGLSTVSNRATGIVVAFLLGGAALVLYLRLFLNWSLVIPATVLEGGWFKTSVRRSTALAEGRRWRILVVYLLVIGFTMIISFAVQMLFVFAIAVFRIRDPEHIQAALQAVQAIGLFISSSLFGSVATIALTLIYYDERVRKEGFDMELMMAGLQGGQQAAATSPSA